MSAYAYTIYRGTFIQLPRLLESGAQSKLEFVCNQGALWVSAEDGRIKGFDWQVRGEDGFRALMRRMGWVDVDVDVDGFTNGDGGNGSFVKVKVVTAVEERNEFFFPGFIGT
jgi:guanine deaminase